MSEYEIADYSSSTLGNFLSAIAIYFSIITAYVVAAFVAGDRFSKSQLSIVNINFTIAAGVMGLLSVLIFIRFFDFASKVQGSTDTALVDFTIPLAILIIAIYISCLVFMRTTRRDLNDV